MMPTEAKMGDPKDRPVAYLLVRGTAVNDSRLHHQAITLSKSGFRVIVLASHVPGLPWEEERNAFVIRRFPYPPHYRLLRFYARLPFHARTLHGKLVRRLKTIRNALRRRYRIFRNKVLRLLRRARRLPYRAFRKARRIAGRAFPSFGRTITPSEEQAVAQSTRLVPDTSVPTEQGSSNDPAGDEKPEESNAAELSAQPSTLAPPPPAYARRASPAEKRRSQSQRLGAVLLAFHSLTVKIVRAPIVWWPFDRPFRMIHFIWHCFWLARKEPGDVYQGRRLESLPAAFILSRLHKAKLVYDCSDLALVAAETVHIKGWRHGLLKKYEGYLSRRSNAILVVSEPMVGYMVDLYQVKPPVVISNFPYRVNRLPEVSYMHQALGLPESDKLILYLGGIRPGRALDSLIESISYLDEGHLVILGYGTREGLQQMARRFGVEELVRFLPPVPPEDVIAWASGAHVGVHPMQAYCFNQEIALPNKIFQYLMAGLPAVVTRGTEMAKLIETHRAGVICDPDNPRDMARAIREVLEAPNYPDMRRRARESALRFSCWEHQEQKLGDTYWAVLNGRQPDASKPDSLTVSRR